MRGSLAVPKIRPQNAFPSKRILSDLHRRNAFDKLGGLDEFTGQQVFKNDSVVAVSLASRNSRALPSSAQRPQPLARPGIKILLATPGSPIQGHKPINNCRDHNEGTARNAENRPVKKSL